MVSLKNSWGNGSPEGEEREVETKDSSLSIVFSPEEVAFLEQVLASVHPQGDTLQVLATMRLAGNIAKKMEVALSMWDLKQKLVWWLLKNVKIPVLKIWENTITIHEYLDIEGIAAPTAPPKERKRKMGG
jgi:hypothetical protein